LAVALDCGAIDAVFGRKPFGRRFKWRILSHLNRPIGVSDRRPAGVLCPVVPAPAEQAHLVGRQVAPPELILVDPIRRILARARVVSSQNCIFDPRSRVRAMVASADLSAYCSK
jgi:hypothetical protein